MKLPLTLIVLAKDEEANLSHCLLTAAPRVERIVVVDDGSADRTVEIAKKFGADVKAHPMVNQAEQFNWALDHCAIATPWIMRLDADEVVPDDLWEEITAAVIEAPSDVGGFYLRRRMYFLGRWIRHGGYYPAWLLRIFRAGAARSELRAMDEHLVLQEGRAAYFRHDFRDENHKDLSWWIEKHNRYATREATAVLEGEQSGLPPRLLGTPPERQRWLKNNVYGRLPLFIRPTLYFLYRYIVRLGFLDGRQGLIFHFLQGFWYRFLVDAKLWAMRRATSHS